jgi:hypothetical protein
VVARFGSEHRSQSNTPKAIGINERCCYCVSNGDGILLFCEILLPRSPHLKRTSLGAGMAPGPRQYFSTPKVRHARECETVCLLLFQVGRILNGSNVCVMVENIVQMNANSNGHDNKLPAGMLAANKYALLVRVCA